MRILPSFLLPLAAVACFAVPSLVAQSATTPQTATASTKKVKTIKFKLQNTTKSQIDLKSGDEQISLAAGQSREVKAPSGTRLVTTSPSNAGQAGTVLAEVSDDTNGSTINLR